MDLLEPAATRRLFTFHNRAGISGRARTWLHLGPRLRLRCPLANKSRYVHQVGARFGLAEIECKSGP